MNIGMSTVIIKKAKFKNLKDLIYLLFEDDLGKEKENLKNFHLKKHSKSNELNQTYTPTDTLTPSLNLVKETR